MRYMLLVSHGQLAAGLGNALGMLVGPKEEIMAYGLEDGKTADEFATGLTELVQGIPNEAEVILLGDIIGGSPLTTATNILMNNGFAGQMVVIGGMNLPLAVTTALMKDSLPLNLLAETVSNEAKDAIKEFKLITDEEEEI